MEDKKKLIYSGHALSCTTILQACHINKGNKYFNLTEQSQKSQLAGGRTVGYLQRVTEDSNYRETNPTSGRVEA